MTGHLERGALLGVRSHPGVRKAVHLLACRGRAEAAAASIEAGAGPA